MFRKCSQFWVKENIWGAFVLLQFVYRFFITFFLLITARIKSSKAGPTKRVSRTFLRRTVGNISHIHTSHYDTMWLIKPQQTHFWMFQDKSTIFHLCFFFSHVPSHTFHSDEILFYGFRQSKRFASGAFERCSAGSQTVTCPFRGACGDKTSGNKLRQETEYIIFSTTSRETNNK